MKTCYIRTQQTPRELGRYKNYNMRMNAAIPKPARTAACTEVACVLEFCMCGLVVSPETSEQH